MSHTPTLRQSADSVNAPAHIAVANSQVVIASAHQFGTLIERMMPSSISEMPEGKLVTAIFKQAWNDAACHTSARRFFTDLDGGMAKWCKLTGLNAEQIKSVYLKNHRVNQEVTE